MTNLSTSNSKTQVNSRRRPWHRRSLDILGAVMVVALVEVGLHICVDQLNVSSLGVVEKKQGLTMRAGNIDAAISKSEAVEAMNVAIIGSSISDGIDTAQLSNQLGDSAVENFLMVGADSSGTARVLENILLPNLDINWVVYMLSPHDVNALTDIEARNVSIPGIDSYAENPLVYKLSRQLEKHLYLFRFRGDIIQMIPNLNSARALLRQRSSAPEVAEPYEYASYESFEEADRFKGDLERVYQMTKADGAKLAILVIPTNPDPAITSDEFQQAADSWLDSLKAFSQARNLPLVNGFEAMDSPTQYRDTHHLSREGIDEMTQLLGETIQSADDP